MTYFFFLAVDFLAAFLAGAFLAVFFFVAIVSTLCLVNVISQMFSAGVHYIKNTHNLTR